MAERLGNIPIVEISRLVDAIPQRTKLTWQMMIGSLGVVAPAGIELESSCGKIVSVPFLLDVDGQQFFREVTAGRRIREQANLVLVEEADSGKVIPYGIAATAVNDEPNSLEIGECAWWYDIENDLVRFKTRKNSTDYYEGSVALTIIP